VINIGDWAFEGCISLTEIIIPNRVISIGDGAFEGCIGLISVEFESPSNVTHFGDRTFLDCTGLIDITIPDSVTTIGSAAFRGCTDLTSIIIPISVIDIGEGVFRDCPELTIYAKAPSKPIGWHENWNPDDRPVNWGHIVSEVDKIESVCTTVLMGNFPNPFNPYTSIRYKVSGIGDQFVQIDIYNIRGQRVRSLVNEYMHTGEHKAIWNGKNDNGMPVSSGVYFYRFSSGDYTETRRMLLMK